MHKSVCLSACLLLAFHLSAQEPGEETGPGLCGTPPGTSLFLKNFEANRGDYPEFSTDTLYAGVQVHLLARDNGAGRLAFDRMLDAFCQLNLDFAPSNIQFFYKFDWNMIDSTAWFQHSTIPKGIEMMLTNNVPGALNAYFMGTAAGNAGYNLPYAGVAVRNADATLNNHTWTHEVGHALALEHPFIGWENTNYNPNQPTPEKVIYDYTYFHDTLDTTVPAPLDTALVEYVDGSNCGIAADRICDTPPDYINTRWSCNAQGFSPLVQKDPAGVGFQSDGSLYMSYALDQCQTRFSPGQTDVMRAYLLTVKSDWLAAGAQGSPVNGSPQLIAPVGSMPVSNNGVKLNWERVPGATHYVVQVARFSSFAVKEHDVIVSDTFFTTKPLLADQTYFWRVRPFNRQYTCTAFSPTEKFETVVAVPNLAEAAGWRLYPTLLRPGQALTVEIPETARNQPCRLQVFEAGGRRCWQTDIGAENAVVQIHLPSAGWQTGVYHLVWQSERGIIRKAVLIQN